jgi:hypothetical protein
VLNTGIGVNHTNDFVVPYGEGGEDLPYTFYFELGLSRFLYIDLKRTVNGDEFPMDTTHMFKSGDWFFPNIEIGRKWGVKY